MIDFEWDITKAKTNLRKQCKRNPKTKRLTNFVPNTILPPCSRKVYGASMPSVMSKGQTSFYCRRMWQGISRMMRQ